MSTKHLAWVVLISALCLVVGVYGSRHLEAQPNAADAVGEPAVDPSGCTCTMEYSPVCGADGQTYSNECVAHCQGIQVASTGPCTAGDVAQVHVHDKDCMVGKSHMEMFHAEGFKYTGKARMVSGTPEPRTRQPMPAGHHNSGRVTNGRFVRVTRDGHMYVSDAVDDETHAAILHPQEPQGDGTAAANFAASTDASASSSSSSSEEGVESRPRGRSLQGIFSPDHRIDCPRSVTFPFAAVGQIQLTDSQGDFVCTGTLVGPDVVLTAAHCVYHRKTMAFFTALDYAPGRYHDPKTKKPVSPLGVSTWSYVTMYEQYMSTSATVDVNIVDIAVIKLTSRMGDYVGWMGIEKPCKSTDSSYVTYLATMAGYPNDQPSGSCKTTTCQVTQDPCTNNYLYHKCDTVQGQSGSAMWQMMMTPLNQMGPYIRAVHNLEWSSKEGDASQVYTNSAVAITPEHYANIMKWIASAFTNNETAVAYTKYPVNPALQVGETKPQSVDFKYATVKANSTVKT